MRHASKLWDKMHLKPIRLKQRLAESGRSVIWLAEELTRKGYKISRVTMWGVINKQYETSEHNRLKALVEEILTANNISKSGIWQTLPGAEWRMRQFRPRKRRFDSSRDATSYVSTGLNNLKEEEMNYTRKDLDDEVLRHFGLESDPFGDIVNYTDVWVSPRYKIIERQIYDTVKRHSIMAVVGDVGAGKSTLLRYVLTKMTREKIGKIIFLDRQDRKQMNGASITSAIVMQLGGKQIPRNGIQRDSLARKLLEDSISMGFNPLLVIDEAHDLKEEVLIGLKRIWDSGMLFKTLAILLVGQGDNGSVFDLKNTLENNPFIREFSERCLLVEMGNLNGSMAQYLDFRFKKAGGDVHKVFSDKALHILAKRAEAPQLANNIAVRAMQHAYRDGKTQVAPEHVAGA